MKNFFFLLFLFVASHNCRAQAGDSARQEAPSWLRRAYQSAWLSIQRDRVDSSEFWRRVPQIAEAAFKPYEGKIVRHIAIVKLDFNHQLLDTSTQIGNAITRLATDLHATTKDWVLRNHLFVREGQPLNAYQVADNERFLRTLSFIQDVRILPAPVGPAGVVSDSVDLVVISKDVFSLGADVPFAEFQRVGLRGFDANFLGMGQRLQATVLYDLNRRPHTGFDVSISRSSIGGSFINGGVGFSTINTGRSDGNEDESAGFIRLDKPLISPSDRFAGGLELSINQSNNFFRKPDSLFYDYRYNVADVWGGVNFTFGREAYQRDRNRRQRVFVGLRYLQNNFTLPPKQVTGQLDPVYNDRQAVLAAVTLFRLNYYRTNYFYGFGLTEDLPKGHRFTATTGWYRWNQVQRPYLGIDLLRYSSTPSGKYFQTFLRAGSFLGKGSPEDAGLLVGTTAYSRLYEPGRHKYRQRISGSFTLLYNPVVSTPLRIDNAYGLPGYGTDSVLGASRASLWSESIMFIDRKYFGFKAAPFVFGGLSVIGPEREIWKKPDVFTGVGAGLRVRNENLIFGTVEARFTWFPKVVRNISPFYIDVAANLRFRYRTNYVQAPQIFAWNEEIW